MKRTIAVVTMSLFATTAAFAGEVGRRQERQQARIIQGVKSGALTPREAARLERNEARLEAEKIDMREDNNGKLTRADYVKLNRQLNRLSRAIYYQKHDGRTR
jgi:hypothetical protein